MGKFIQEDSIEKKVLSNYFDNYLDTTERYSKWLQGSPTFVTYYSINLESSTQDQGLNNVMEVVGGESPIKYNKIEDFPIYLEGEMNFSTNLEEDAGFDSESEGSAIILPGTIVPQNDDLIVFNILEKNYIYRVANVEFSNTSIRKFYKISFFVSPFDIETLESRQVKDEYSVIYNNIGTENDPVISKKEFTFLDDIDKIIDYLSERYIRFYYDKKTNSFVYNLDKMNMTIHDFYKDNGIYDPKLALFIKRNNLFINKKTFLKNIYVECLLQNRDLDYENSIYSLFETLDLDEFKYPYYYFININESVFMLVQDKFHEVVHNPVDIYNKGNKLLNDKFKSGKFTSIDLIKYTKDIKLLIDDLPINEKIMIIYLRCRIYEEQNNITDYLEDIVNLAKDVKVDKNFYTYIQIPCIIYILKEIKNIIMHSTNYIK
jgi:hypothetical protein